MIQVIPLSSLEKVFHDEAPKGRPFGGCSFLRGEELSFQAAFCTEEDGEVFPEISGGACEAFWVEEIPCEKVCYDDSDDYFLRKTPGLYPDLLRPATEPLRIRAGEWHSLWLTLQSEASTEVSVRLGEARVVFRFECLPERLPDQALLCTHWFHCDCLAQAYHVEVFSETHWEIIENYLRCAAAHGMNLLYTPLFTPPLDTEIGGERPTVQLVGVAERGGEYAFDFTLLRRWFALGESCGMRAFELSHLFTQWGAEHAPKVIVNGVRRFGWETDADSQEYAEFLGQFGRALLLLLEELHLTERCYAHVSDEPCEKDIEQYAERAALIRRYFPGLKLLDALSDYEFYRKGLMERPVPSNDAIGPFIGKVPELWTYYCCSQHKDYVANRFFAMPSARSRVLGLQLWKFRCAGFLHWGFNFWNAQLSKHPVDPFACPDAGAAFPAGDAFVVYPGSGGQPLCSLRWKVFHEALQDLRALQLLESKIGYDSTLALLERGLEKPLTFGEYPQGAQWLLEVRERVNEALSCAIQ
ncbi:MAG: DUF4091 domain-containing protein [Oscillospiraceae bacterium]|jgi:hypothetical protein|nr:DUF4091 domain-containing protein [Oscillospiraceae bacterium]